MTQRPSTRACVESEPSFCLRTDGRFVTSKSSVSSSSHGYDAIIVHDTHKSSSEISPPWAGPVAKERRPIFEMAERVRRVRAVDNIVQRGQEDDPNKESRITMCRTLLSIQQTTRKMSHQQEEKEGVVSCGAKNVIRHHMLATENAGMTGRYVMSNS